MQADRRQPSRRLIIGVRLPVVVERQLELRCRFLLGLQRGKAPCNGLFQSAGTRVRALVENGECEPHIAIAIAMLGTNGAAEVGQQRVCAARGRLATQSDARRVVPD